MKIAFSIAACLFSLLGVYLCIFEDSMVEGLLWLCLASLNTINAKLY